MRTFCALCIALLFSTATVAQDSSNQEDSTGESSYQPGFVLADSKEAMRVVVPGLSGAKGDMIYAFNYLMSRKDVRKSLEITDSQIAELKGAGRFKKGEFEDALDKYFESREVERNPIERQKAARKILNDKYFEAREKVNEVMLPHQIESLDIMACLATRDRLGVVGLIDSYWGRDVLGLSEKQLESVRDRHKKEQVELAKKIEELKRQAEMAVLEELTNAQRTKTKNFIRKVDERTQETKQKVKQLKEANQKSEKSNRSGK